LTPVEYGLNCYPRLFLLKACCSMYFWDL